MSSKTSPSVASVREAKRALDQALLAAIQSFERETGLHVRDVGVHYATRIDRSAPETIFVQTEVQL